MRKVFSILLCLCMVLQYVPTTAFAVTTAEDGLCNHHTEHTAECGYVEGVSNCIYHCHICHVQELIDALPAEVTAENEEAVKAQLTAIDSEKASLSGAELSQVDFTNYTAATEALSSFYAAVPAAETYAVVISVHEVNCTVTADKSSAATGETVTLTVTPADGYELDTLTVEWEEGTVSVTEVEAGKTYTFVMPDYEAIVHATFKEKETTPTCTCTSKCVDIGNPDCAVCAADRSACGFTGDVEPDVPVTPPTQSSYNVTIAETNNGTVTADKSTAAEGETVTLTVNPDAGYELDTLKISNNTDGDVPYVPVTKIDDTSYTFTMPAGEVTVTATFKATTTPRHHHRREHHCGRHHLHRGQRHHLF